MTEYGTPNGQIALDLGVCMISTVANKNCSSLTGSTSNLGNASGTATSTINEINGTYNTYNDSGKTAVSYRGVENPWGNLWHIVSDVLLYGN